jgi:hypothetical protein
MWESIPWDNVMCGASLGNKLLFREEGEFYRRSVFGGGMV